MRQYVVIEDMILNIYESQGRFVIKINFLNLGTKKLIDLLTKLLIDNRESYIEQLITIELPVQWIKKEYIKDYKFIKQYYPEFLI